MTPGTIALLWFPFSHSEPEPYKKRPVLVLGSSGAVPDQAIFVAMVTSSARRFRNPGAGDLVIRNWEDAGLTAPSIVRTRRIWTAEARDVERELGRVDQAVLDSAREEVRKLLR